MKRPIIFAVAPVLLSMPFAAHAQVDNKDEHFDGPYIGGSFGASVQSNDNGETLVFDTDGDGNYDNQVSTAAGDNAFSPGFCGGLANASAPADGCRSDKDGYEYFLRAGYDKRMGNFVVGAVVEGGRSEAVDRVTGFSTTPASYSLSREADYNIGARLRAGYTPGGGILFYGTGGGAYARLDNNFVTTNGANAFADNGKTNAWGWTAGGGVEAMLTNNVSMGLEYLYTSLSDDDYTVNVTQGTAPDMNPFLLDSGQTDIRRSDDDFTTQSIRLTLGYHF